MSSYEPSHLVSCEGVERDTLGKLSLGESGWAQSRTPLLSPQPHPQSQRRFRKQNQSPQAESQRGRSLMFCTENRRGGRGEKKLKAKRKFIAVSLHSASVHRCRAMCQVPVPSTFPCILYPACLLCILSSPHSAPSMPWLVSDDRNRAHAPSVHGRGAAQVENSFRGPRFPLLTALGAW